ncbi:NAD(P)/FAD-dependent oxidoreductase [Saccharopolyspora sp. HNM0983]|uniref:NAD(P)/FAD-dependent oxidoreductase n=1 Tax=Saccharopolyspora montiporae TaxID=2781240 RepID=A0A929BBZ9_9PSEU|nr:NAD(P)/FAD-dependent oxidoreductase [Saccharopolyspora sp. HNM0983]MBE9375236.1 NAD(P)/FAD-dependent oxidoreductase [Saccharopolyspora sp. HNM0983]
MTEQPPEYDAIIIGAGFAGMYMLTKLRERGFAAHVFEAGDDVGGTWYWNRYPGARCDVESLYYCYSFSEQLQQEWEWTERYPSQPEILRYARHVADRFDLRRDITFSTTVHEAAYDERHRCWRVRTAGGSTTARHLITAVGCLSATQTPDFPGIDDFRGESYHTGRWPHRDVDFGGKRVGVIGTGSSAIQAIPLIAQQARQVTVFQRTAQFSIPAWNRTLDPAEQAAVKADYARLRDEARHSRSGILQDQLPDNATELPRRQVESELHRRWGHGGTTFTSAFPDTLTDAAANEISAEFVRARIREIVDDPATADLLCPTDHPIGTKRICVDTDYYATYNRDNVDLVSVREQPISRITDGGVQVGDRAFAFDVLVFATGYDAMTGPLNRIDIRGADGSLLRDKWAAGPRSYLGLAGAGFPNMFTITGPGSPSVLSNMIVSIEQHVEWIAEHLEHLRDRGLTRTEADPGAEDEWVAHVNEVAGETLYPQAASWYMGANIPGKPRIFLPYIGGVGTYREICREVADEGYRGFHLAR